MVLMPGFQSTRLATDGALEPFYFLYTDDSIQGNPETCKQSSIMLNYEIKNSGLLFPNQKAKVTTSKRMPDYAYIRKELLRNGVNKKLLWTEYLEECRLAGDEPLMYSQFCYYIQQD